MAFKIKSFLFILILCFLITNVSAVDILKPANFNQSYTIIQTCASCTFVNVTISNVNGIIFSNEEMIDNGSGIWIFDMTPTVMSRHDVDGSGDINNVITSFATFFEVTPSGKVASTGDSIFYSVTSLILFGFICMLYFFIFTMPSTNEKDNGGFETKIIKVKYFRVAFIVITYGLTILLLNFLTGLAVNFSALSMFAGILGFLFETMLRLAWAFTVIMIAWIVVMLVHDTNLKKHLKSIETFDPFRGT